MLSDTVLKVISSLNEEIDLLDYTEDLNMMTENNCYRELKKPEKYRRTPEVIEMHTAMGLGAEKALHKTGYFKPTSKITKYAIGHTFEDLKRDVLCENLIGEIKTKNAKNPNWYISKSQYKSVGYATNYNDFFLIVAYDQINRLKYRYRPQYLIDSKSIMSYIDTTVETKYESYTFNHRKAIADGVCVDLWSVA